MKALIKVGYGCNNHCTFCHTLDVRDVDGAEHEVHAKIERAAQLGHTMIVLSGGEPTMRPELLRWAAHAAKLGLDVGLVTNGRMLAYRDLVERLLRLRLRYVYLSLHGGDAKVHNLMVRADAFEQTYAAIGNLAGRGLDFTVNAVVTRQNVEHLRPIVDAMRPYPDVVLKFSMVQPKGGGEKLFEHLIPPVALVAERVRDAIAYGRAQGDGRYAHDGIPLCLVPGLEDLYDDLKTHRFRSMIEIGEPDFFPVDDQNKTHPPACADCALRGPCPGLYTGYLESFGDAELRPVRDRARSNSFTYVFEKSLAPINGACSIERDGVTPWDRGRDLFVATRDRLVRYRTETRDFSDAEIAAIKHRDGQVYLDVSEKSAPDDFAADLRALRRSERCTPCAERDRCTGLFEPVREDVFTRDDAAVREAVAALRGEVLDVGCGHGPYESLLGPLAERGAIRYVGIDPDAERIASLRSRWPWAELAVARAEDVPFDAARFDHVVVLRSWNHVGDPARAAASLVRVLRPGGRLLVVDNVAFGLARSRAQSTRAEHGPARFEHYRNDHAADAARAFAGTGATLVRRIDVAPTCSNQWLLEFRAPALETAAHVPEP